MVEVEEIELDLGLSIGGTFTRKHDQEHEQEQEQQKGKNKRQKIEKTTPFHVQLLPFNNNENGLSKVQSWDKNNGENYREGKSCNGSSIFSDHQASSYQDGGSSESNNSHSGHSFAEQTQMNISKGNYTTNQAEQSASSKLASINANQTNSTTKPEQTTESKETKVVGISKPPKPMTQTSSTSLPQMPYVSTSGPNGKTVNGFLYKYSKSEVSIVCVCHGSTFSPSEFVQHAGGSNISQPLKHITVIPYAFR